MKKITMAATQRSCCSQCGSAQAADEPLDARARRLHVCRRQDHAGRRPRISLRPDVRRDPHPGEADASLSDHHGARRLDVRHQLHRHARRPRRLGAVFRPPGLRRLRRRPARPRPLRIPHRRAWTAAKLRARQFGVALRLAGKIQAVAAGRAAHPMARQRRGRRSGDAAARHEPIAGDRGLRQAAADRARRADRAGRQDRPVDPDDAFARRRVRLAGGGCAARQGQGDPRDRAERPARARPRIRRRAGLLQGGQARADLRHHVGADHLCAGARPIRPI